MSFVVAQPVRGNLKDLSEYFDKKVKDKRLNHHAITDKKCFVAQAVKWMNVKESNLSVIAVSKVFTSPES